jgi:alanine-glyoxylate transaminase/serine-glyoxylate transaminase/serine-pyruvate transaminase
MTGLHAALEQLTRRQPFAQVQAHRAAIGRALLAGLTACGFKPWPSGCADVAPITVVEPPPGIDADGLIRAINDRYGVQVGAGLGQLAGRILRVSHIGIELFHVFGLLGALSVASGAAGDAAAAEASRAYAETIAERATA